MANLTQMQILGAAYRAPKVYPGPVGAALQDDLIAYAELNWLWCNGKTSRLMRELVADIMTRPMPVKA